MTVALCLLTWNEIKSCKLDVPEIDRSRFDQVFAVDGGSTDGTVEYLKSEDIDVRVQPVKGYNQAYIYAFDVCECDYLILFHPKATVPIEDLYKFRDLFEVGCSLVVASRMITGAVNEEDTRLIRPRKWFVKLLSLVAYIIWGKYRNKVLWDVLHGFRGMKKADFLAIDPLPGGLSMDLEMVVRSYRNNFQYAEFPTKEQPRVHGDTHFKAFATGKLLLRYLWLELFRDA